MTFFVMRVKKREAQLCFLLLFVFVYYAAIELTALAKRDFCLVA